MPSEEASDRLGVAGWIVPQFFRALLRIIYWAASLKVSGVEAFDRLESSGKKAIVVFFHGRMFLILGHLKGYKYCGIVSASRDGEILTRVLTRLGFKIVRGSSSRGGARAMIGLKKLFENGYHAAFPVDGPRGPLHVVKPGAVYLAKKTGAPLLPLTSSAKPAHIFSKAWDKFIFPYPFSRGVIAYGEPIYLDSDLSEEAVKRDCIMLQEELLKLQEAADRVAGYKSS